MADLEGFLVKDRTASHGYALWFCRGPGKCTRKASEKMRLNRLHLHCPDCVKGSDDETLAHLKKRIDRGDA